MSPKRRALLLAGLAAIAWLALCALADGYVRHGWNATWYTTHAGRRVVVDRTIEHRVEFPNVHRPLARYVQGWPFERIPRPTELPAIDAVLRADLRVPQGPALYVSGDARRDATVTVDDRPARTGPLHPGVHRVSVHWRGQPVIDPRGGSRADQVRFALRWGETIDEQSAVPSSALTPASGAFPPSRVVLLVAAILGALLWAFFVLYAQLASTEAARRRRHAALLGVLIVLIGTAYRTFDYDVMPEFRENADELFATWNGWSLLHDGTTRGWSLWPAAYGGTVEHTDVRFFGERRPVISPYFEHPPLLHVLVGAAAHLGGAEHYLDAKLKHTRIVPILLSAISIALLLLVARRLYPRSKAPWMGALLFAVLPSIAIQTRVIKEEILLVPLSLAMVYFFLCWRDDGRKTRHLVFAAICAGLSPLAKVPSVVWVPALAMLIAAEHGQFRRALWAALIGLGIASLLLVFGALIDWNVFLFAESKQATRPTHWNLFTRFYDFIEINHNAVGLGYLLFLWLGYAATAFRRGMRESAPFTVPMVAYLVAMGIGAGNWTFGWYLVPIYPFLCLGAGEFLADLYERPSFLGGMFFITLVVYYALNFTLDGHWAKQAESWPFIRVMVTLTTLVTFTPYALAQIWPKDRYAVGAARSMTAAGLALVVVLSGVFVFDYDATYETYRNFDRDVYFTHP